jgi:phosphoglycerol geranylgeranyltransferase
MAALDDVARAVGRLASVVRSGVRTLGPVDSNPVPADWTHVTKLDPEHEKKLPLLYPLYLQHTSAVSVGGSSDVTADNTEETFTLLSPLTVPVFHEPSGPRHITHRTRDAAAFIAIPEVLNGDSESLVGTLGVGIEHIRERLAPELLDDALPRWTPARIVDALANVATSVLLSEAVFEAYIIQNPDSAAAREANVGPDDLLNPGEAKQHAMAAERHLDSELVYLEYSGTYGDDEAAAILDAVSDGLDWSRLWYGGGLDSREGVETMLDAGADTVVVGNAFHDVADEEAELVAAATEDLAADADEPAVREWLTETVDVADSAAARYLSTVPSVADPVATAEDALVASLRTAIELDALAAAVAAAEPSTRAELRTAVDDAGTLPGARYLDETMCEHPTAMARSTTVDVLARRLGLDVDERLPVSHLSTDR